MNERHATMLNVDRKSGCVRDDIEAILVMPKGMNKHWQKVWLGIEHGNICQQSIGTTAIACIWFRWKSSIQVLPLFRWRNSMHSKNEKIDLFVLDSAFISNQYGNVPGTF